MGQSKLPFEEHLLGVPWDGLWETLWEASTALQAVADRAHGWRQKADQSPVTAADQMSHQLIRGYLQGHSPCPVLSEESAEEETDLSMARGYWILDPLDGTREFLAGRDEFTINLGYVQDGYPIWGAVVVPACGLCYTGGMAWGSWVWGPDQAPQRLQIQPAGQQPCRVVLSRSHGVDAEQGLLPQPCIQEIQGSAWKFCRIAAGEADLYVRLGPTGPWDTAAGQAVVEGAGGVVYTAQGERLDYHPGRLKNPPFWAMGCRMWWEAIPRKQQG